MAPGREQFTTLRTEGGLFSADFIQRLSQAQPFLDGLTPQSYHLTAGEKLNEATSRSWNRLVGTWAAFQASSKDLKEGDPGTTVTREKWLLPLFQELGYGRLVAAKPSQIEDKSYPISHAWSQTPIHLVGRNVELDRTTRGVPGAARRSPHSLLQEFLNRSQEQLWGFLSNGLKLRILRDNKSLTRQAYVEFDLFSMMEGQVYSDFALLWLLCHQSRVEAEKPEDCWLERWAKAAQEQGTRALDDLRSGVEKAILALGRGFLAHPANANLHEQLKQGVLSRQDYYRQLLRTVYRLIFLFVAEDRDLLQPDSATAAAKDRYRRFYSTQRLRTLAERRRGTAHGDLWRGLTLVFEKLGSDEGCPELGLSPLGSFLWSDAAAANLQYSELSNAELLEAIRSLAFIVEGKVRRAIDYKNLGPEELGSVYEALLELHPEVNADAGTFELSTAGGHERKTTGSYYTPTSLISCLLDSALDPVIAQAAAKPDPEKAVLALKVCDPACGSGHFLIAAAHRIAKRLASVRTGDDEPSPEALRTALRDVIGHCIYGVDVNPMAVELCKVNLWLEALEPGKPLSFLEHRILCGNSLLGTTPALLAEGIPDEAFDPIEGDEKAVARDLKKRSKREREAGVRTFAFMSEPALAVADADSVPVSDAVRRLDTIPDDTIRAIHEKERRHRELAESAEYRNRRLAADTWCAAFVWKKAKDAPPAITDDLFRAIRSDPDSVSREIRSEIERLTEAYGFFHWQLGFPNAFRSANGEEQTQDGSGFDVVLGNPPWERVKLQEKEFFAERDPEIARASNAAARGKLIKQLQEENPTLLRAFQEARREAEGASHLIRNSGRYPLCGRGDINTYAVFAELNRSLIGGTGRVGCIVPSGIATDDTTKHFFQDLVDTRSLVSLFDFRNRGFFPGAAGAQGNRFCLLTLARAASEEAAEFLFRGEKISDLLDPERRYSLGADDFAILNPNTRTCPIFRTRRDAEITKAIYRRVPVLIDESKGAEGNPWDLTFLRMLDMANDSGLFRTRTQLEADGWKLQGNVFEQKGEQYLPVYEAKMVHQFDHRYGDYALAKLTEKEVRQLPQAPSQQLANPAYQPMPRYWAAGSAVNRRLARKESHAWLLGWRDICSGLDERTVIAAVIPCVGVGHKLPLIISLTSAPFAALLEATMNSFVFDYGARQKLGGTSLTYFVLKQLPTLPPAVFAAKASWFRDAAAADWFRPRVLELTYSAWDLLPFARDLGYGGPPFCWDPERRFKIRCEIDAAFFHLYGIPRDDAAYILDTFPIVRRNDEKQYANYRTKLVILEIYDRLQTAIKTGIPYQTLLDPSPGDARVAHSVNHGRPERDEIVSPS